MSEKIGSKIRALRLEKKLTLDQLAEKSDSSKSYLWELENKDPAAAFCREARRHR